MENQSQRKPKILCLHGFRTSGEILKQLVLRWPEAVLQKLDFVFLDGQFPAQGRSDVEGIFDPPYYEWFQANEDFTEYTNFEECLEYIEDYMLKNGPFDGLLGFSQGAILAAALPGMQAQGVALGKVNKIKFLIEISGAKFGENKFGMPKLASNAFSKPIDCPSLHFIGENDFMKAESIALLEAFQDPVVIHHPRGHTVPKLVDESLEIMLKTTFPPLKNLAYKGIIPTNEVVFLDAPLGPAQGKSGLQGYEWFHANEDFTEYTNFEEGLAYIEDYMVQNSPFDGVLGLSQGALLSTAMPGMQAQGVALAKAEKIKFLIVIFGAKFGGKKFAMPELAKNAYAKIINIPSLHFIGGETAEHIAALEAFKDPVVIYHHQGHTVPKLDGKNLETLLDFIHTINSE